MKKERILNALKELNAAFFEIEREMYKKGKMNEFPEGEKAIKKYQKAKEFITKSENTTELLIEKLHDLLVDLDDMYDEFEELED